MLIVYKGDKYNIMDSKKPVSLKIVEGLSSKIDYAFDENAEYQNRLEIQING